MYDVVHEVKTLLYMCNDREHTYLKKVTALLHIMVSKLKYDFFNKACIQNTILLRTQQNVHVLCG